MKTCLGKASLLGKRFGNKPFHVSPLKSLSHVKDGLRKRLGERLGNKLCSTPQALTFPSLFPSLFQKRLGESKQAWEKPYLPPSLNFPELCAVQLCVLDKELSCLQREEGKEREGKRREGKETGKKKRQSDNSS
jgi:hypothetical protein